MAALTTMTSMACRTTVSKQTTRAKSVRQARRVAQRATTQVPEDSVEEVQPSRRGAVFSGAAAAAAVTTALTAAPQEASAGLFGSSEPSSWESVALPVEPEVILLGIASVPNSNGDHAFVTGTRQTLLETKDGGKSWSKVTVPGVDDEEFNYRFNSVDFAGEEGWIVGTPPILLHTKDAGASWERIPLSSKLPGRPVQVTALGDGSAEMCTDQGAIYTTSNEAFSWTAAVAETVEATLNRTVSSGISGASYYTGAVASIVRNPSDGSYLAVNQRGNFYLTWQPGDEYWMPHNRASARRIAAMGFSPEGEVWMLTRGGGMYFNKGGLMSEDFQERRIASRGYGLLDIGWGPQGDLYCAGGSASLFKSTDNGKSWKRDRSVDDIGANFYEVNFSGAGDSGWVLGSNATLLKYRA